MPFSHHSHSGQFCPGHAQNTLEEMVQTAIAKGMRVYALTEHMPRHVEDFYPDEHELGYESIDDHQVLIDGFWEEANRLKQKYADKIELLVGFESEWIRKETLPLIKDLLSKRKWDIFVGSVHHVHTQPIDYDHRTYELARKAAGGTDERLFEDYFDAQYEMLKELRPPVVGHFDLVRLKSDEPDATMRKYDGVWKRVERNLKFVAEYGGILELNSSALRKGMSEPYPKTDICQLFLAMGGRFCLSDDAHSVEQVGLNYARVLEACQRAGITSIHYCRCSSEGLEVVESMPVAECVKLLSGSGGSGT